MTTERSRSEAFWDDAFAHDADSIRDTPAYELKALLALAGPFHEDYARATAVLDAGPGRARLLRMAQAKRYAIEVSGVNRLALAKLGIVAVSPSDATLLDAGSADLAWSVACFQHCTHHEQDQLLQQVRHLLKRGGSFYLEHAGQRRDRPDCAEAARLSAGRYTVEPGALLERARTIGLDVRLLATHSLGQGVPVYRWVARFERA